MKKDIQNLKDIYEAVASTPDTQTERAAEPLVDALNDEVSGDDTSDVDFDDLLINGTEGGVIEQFEDTDLPVYNYKKLALYIEMSYDTKKPLLIYGEPGLGKSSLVQRFAKNVAAEKHREFIFWNKTNDDEKLTVLENPGKYFVLVDIRAAQIEPTEIQGIPDIHTAKQYIANKKPSWVYLLSQHDTDGILFLDEINQGARQVLNAFFEVVLDRSAGGTYFSKQIAVMAAGNLGHGNEPIPQALTNRFTCGVLVGDPKSWLEWAEEINLNKYIVSFVKSDPESNFFVRPKNESDPFPTPRQMEVLSKRMESAYQKFATAKRNKQKMPVSLLTVIGDAASGLCGVEWGRKFIEFIKYIQTFNLREVIKNAGSLKSEKADKFYALSIFMTNKIRNSMRTVKGRSEAEVQQTIGSQIKREDFTTDDQYKQAFDREASTIYLKNLNEQDYEVMEALLHITYNVKEDWRGILWSSIIREISSTDMSVINRAIIALGKQFPQELAAFKQSMIGIGALMGKESATPAIGKVKPTPAAQ